LEGPHFDNHWHEMQSDVTFPPSIKRAAVAGFEELFGGIRNWRVWHLTGVRELRHRYARSKVGQVWLILSTAAMIGALTAVSALLWNQPVRSLMPFIPLLGQPASLYAWLSTTVIAPGGIIITLAVIGRYRRRIIFWM
jgi:ABC-type polysaccharide/polyol phosphate export permease